MASWVKRAGGDAHQMPVIRLGDGGERRRDVDRRDVAREAIQEVQTDRRLIGELIALHRRLDGAPEL